MHIVFGRVGYWQIPIIKLFKYFKFKVFYISIGSKSKFQQNEIATQLKKKNITPLPIEFEKQISKKSYSLLAEDSDEVGYKKNIKMIPNKILIKYCNLFSIDEKEVKKLRLLMQDIIAEQQRRLSGRIGIWSNLYPSEKIIFISFKFTSFFTSDVAHNITKIIIPIDIFSHFIKIIKKLFWLLPIFKNKEHKGQVLNSQNFVDLEKKSVAFVTHKGTVYGTGYILFQKTLYYSSDKNSCLNKYNILHMDYSGYLKPEQDMHWVCLNKVKVSSIKFFFRTILACMKTFYLIRSWSTFLVWVLFIQQYAIYIKYCEIIKKFKKLKIAIIDYDCLCPKTLLLAFKKNNIKTVATQERFIHIFCSSFGMG